MPDFRKVSDIVEERKGRFFEPGTLADSEKERLCRSLLAEFGVTHVKVNPDSGEMIHSCCLGLGGHKGNDRNPSASLNFKKLTYNCYGCGNSGGFLWFIGTCRGESGEYARRWLEDQTGTGADEQSLSSLLEFFEAVYNPTTKRSAPIPKMNPVVLDRWMCLHPYLFDVPPEGRGMPVETLKRFMVGYDPEYRVNLGDGKYMTSERVIFPSFWKESLVGWQTRRIFNDGTPKYLSSPDFPKDSTIYNYDSKRKRALVVESVPSVLRHFHNDETMVSTYGASVTDKQMELLAQYQKIVLCFDNDEPGWKATERVGEYLEGYSNVYVIDSIYAADPGDLDDNTFGRMTAEPIPYSIWRRPDPGSIIPL